MKIEVAKIPKSGMILEEQEAPGVLGESLDGVAFREPIQVKVSVNLVGHTVVVQGRLETTAELECNRCLKRFTYAVDVRDYTYSAQVRGDDTVDLTESIREDIILTLPMKRLCSPECKGLCPVCGQDLNVAACECKKSQDWGPFTELDGLGL